MCKRWNISTCADVFFESFFFKIRVIRFNKKLVFFFHKITTIMKEKVVTFLRIKRENYYFSLTARKTKLVFACYTHRDGLFFYIITPDSQLNYTLKLNHHLHAHKHTHDGNLIKKTRQRFRTSDIFRITRYVGCTMYRPHAIKSFYKFRIMEYYTLNASIPR